MGIFDKLLGKDTHSEQIPNSGDQIEGNQQLSKTDDEDSPTIRALHKIDYIDAALAERENQLSRSMRIPYGEIAAVGGVCGQVLPVLQQIVHGGKLGNGSLVRIVFPKGVSGELATLNSTGETIGGILKQGGGFAQARLHPLVLAPETVICMAMASMIVEINEKLDDIQKMQLEILSFLQQDKQAEQEGNLNMLMDIMNAYPFNWDNRQYRETYHVKSVDIKQKAEQNIVFYQHRIADEIKALPAIYFDQVVSDKLKSLSNEFHDYGMALYLFAFSSYIEVMLLCNFDERYLKQVADRVQEYHNHYVEHFSKCQDYIKKASIGSIETQLLGGIGNAGKALGKFIGSTTLLSTAQVDEWLISSGEQVLKANEDKANKLATLFEVEKDTGCLIFEDSIRKVEKVSNHTRTMLLDDEAIYLDMAD